MCAKGLKRSGSKLSRTQLCLVWCPVLLLDLFRWVLEHVQLLTPVPSTCVLCLARWQLYCPNDLAVRSFQ